MPATRLQLTVHCDDITALRRNKLFLFLSQGCAAAQRHHKSSLLRKLCAQPCRMQVQNAARKLCAPGRIVDRKVQRSIHHIAHGIGQLFRRHTEPHGIHAGIALPQAQAAVPALRYRVYPIQHGVLQKEHRGRVLGPIGSQLVELPHTFHGHTVQMDGQVALQRGGMQHRAFPCCPVVQAAAQSGQIFFPHRKARSHGMAAVADEQICAGTNAGMQIEALHAASAALAFAVLVDRHHDHRPAGAFHQPGCHDANDTGVPIAAPQQHHAVFQPLRFLFQQFLRGLEDLQLCLLTLCIDLIQFMGQLCGAVRVLTHHQLQSRNSVVHAASRIDAGRNGVADIFCGDRFARKAHLFQQRFQTRTVRVLQLAQARLDKGAVFAGKRHHVRHSTHSGKVAAVVQHFFRRAAIQCGTQLERHARTTQALEGTGVVLTTGVYHGNGLGQSFRRQMMVGNDQVNAQFSGIIGFFHSRNAVIHRHDQLAALIVDGTDGIARKAVAVALAAGQHTFYGSPHALEMLVQQGRGRHAVHVIIAEHHNGLALVNGPPDALAGLVHIGEQRRVAQFFLTGKQGQCFGRVGDAACRQHARQQGIFLLLGGKGGRIFLLAPRLVVLCVIFQFFGGLLRNRLRQLPQRGTVQRLQIPCTVGHSKFPPVRPSLASIPCRAAISEETSIATSESSVSYRVS